MLLLVGAPAHAAPEAAMDELALVREALGSANVDARLAAVTARAVADGTAPPPVANPYLEGRHEEARGPAGASTDAVGASWSLDLGFAAVAQGRAASLRREAAVDLRRAAVVEVVCDLRRRALDLWAAEGRKAAVDEGHERLGQLLAQLDAQSSAGEVSGYDVARVRVADVVHDTELDEAVVAAAQARAALAALAGRAPEGVALLPLGPPPAVTPDQDPVLAAWRRQEEAAARALAAARRAGVPDLVLTGGVRWDAPPGTQDRTLGWEAGAALELPVSARNQVGVAEAAAAQTQARAAVTRREADVRAGIDAARSRIDTLGPVPRPLDGGSLWRGALRRYEAGEASIDELLVVAEDVESARVAHVRAEHLRRAAHLDLECQVGVFASPDLHQLVLERL